MTKRKKKEKHKKKENIRKTRNMQENIRRIIRGKENICKKEEHQTQQK